MYMKKGNPLLVGHPLYYKFEQDSELSYICIPPHTEITCPVT